MSVNCVAIMSPGDMGHAVGRVLRQHGLDVITCLQGRSDRTQSLSAAAGIRPVSSGVQLVAEADLVLSIVVPAEATRVARVVAESIGHTKRPLHFADCNAVSPQTTEAIGQIIMGAGGTFIDASIIGHPPATGTVAPRFYVSGAEAGIVLELDGKGIEVRRLGDAIGQASAIKMCYAALTKGTFALCYALATAAESTGVFDELCAELRLSQADAFKLMEQNLPRLPAKAFRWIEEMEQIAVTFEQVGVTPRIHRGAADVFRLISETPLGKETPETVDADRTLAETIAIIAYSLHQATGELECDSPSRLLKVGLAYPLDSADLSP